jgi:hypothetical protein
MAASTRSKKRRTSALDTLADVCSMEYEAKVEADGKIWPPLSGTSLDIWTKYIIAYIVMPLIRDAGVFYPHRDTVVFIYGEGIVDPKQPMKWYRFGDITAALARIGSTQFPRSLRSPLDHLRIQCRHIDRTLFDGDCLVGELGLSEEDQPLWRAAYNKWRMDQKATVLPLSDMMSL